MQNAGQSPRQEDDPPPRGPWDRKMSIAAGAIFLLLALAVYADTPADASLWEKALSKTLLLSAIGVILGGVAFGYWRTHRRREP